MKFSIQRWGLLISLLAIVLAGCGSSTDDFVFTNSNNNINPPLTSDTATIVVNQAFVPARAIPTNVTTLRLTGRDAANNVLFGPESQTVDFQNTFIKVPITVTSVTLEYLDAGGSLVGTLVQAVTLVKDQVFTINDPNFIDVVGTATTLRLAKQTQRNAFSTQALVASTVTVFDATGAVVTAANQPVTVELLDPQGVVLSGTTSVTPTNGVAVFNNLVLTGTGTTQLVFRYPTVRPLVTDLITVGTLTDPTALVERFVTIWGTVANGFNDGGFPNFFSSWDIESDLAIDDGFDDAFDGVGELEVGGVSYPHRVFADLTFLTPLMGQSEGLPLPAVANADITNPISGTYSALLAPAAGTRIRQTIDLTAAVAPVTLNWTDEINDNDSNFSEVYEYSVSVLDSNGNPVVGVAPFTRNTWAGTTPRTMDLTAAAGQQVTVQFQALNYASEEDSNDYFPAKIDDVSVTDTALTEFISNGNFETGDFTAWTTQTDPQSQHLRASSVTLSGLDVVRTLYSRPDQYWLRYHDTFTNNTAAPITVDLFYENNLGSDGSGITRFNTTQAGKLAFSSSDSDDSDNDVGFVFGTTFSPDFDGPGYLDVRAPNVTVQPGQTVGVVFFILQSEEYSAGNPPPKVDAAINGILDGFPYNTLYSQGLTLSDINSLINF